MGSGGQNAKTGKSLASNESRSKLSNDNLKTGNCRTLLAHFMRGLTGSCLFKRACERGERNEGTRKLPSVGWVFDIRLREVHDCLVHRDRRREYGCRYEWNEHSQSSTY